MILASRFGLVLLLLAAATWAAVSGTNKVTAAEPIHGFAVGFDLTDSYGTAAVRVAGGDVRRAARVEGDERWMELMQRLALNSSRHMAPPYEWWHDGGAMAGFPDIPRQMVRRARKAVGLPASGDVGIISGMLSALRERTEQALATMLEADAASRTRITVDRIMLTTPELPALYDEDLDDAALHSGLELLQVRPGEWHYRDVPDPDRNIIWTLGPWILRQPKHTHAVFAAHGLAGNLHHPLSPSADPALKKHNVLLVHLTRSGLELGPQVKETNRTCNLGWAQHMGWYNASLAWPSGLSEAEWRRGVAEMVRNALWSEILNKYQNGPDLNVTDVLFAGESGALPALRDTVLDYIRDLPGQSVEPRVWPRADAGDVQDWVENGASYGAAMMAWQFVAEEPLEGSISECVLEDHRNLNHGSEIRYSREGEDSAMTSGVAGAEGQQPLGVEL